MSTVSESKQGNSQSHKSIFCLSGQIFFYLLIVDLRDFFSDLGPGGGGGGGGTK